MSDKCVATCRDGSDCEAYPLQGSDKCRMHAGTSSDGDSHEDNDWAAKHGAYSESFVKDFLTDKEIERVEQMKDILDSDEGVKEDAKLTAAIAKEQWRRTGDERFLRRYESLCDTFGLTPPEEHEVEHSGDGMVINLPDSVTDQWQREE